MNNSEHQEQSALIKWAKLQSITKPALNMLFAIPNGSKRHIAVARKLKAEGVSAGVPDLFLAVPTPYYSGLFIEMKSKKGVVSEHQKIWIARLLDKGYSVKICRSFEEAIAEIEAYLEAYLYG